MLLHQAQQEIESNHSFGTCHLSITQEYTPVSFCNHLSSVGKRHHGAITPLQKGTTYVAEIHFINCEVFRVWVCGSTATKISMISIPEVWDRIWLPLYTPVCVSLLLPVLNTVVACLSNF